MSGKSPFASHAEDYVSPNTSGLFPVFRSVSPLVLCYRGSDVVPLKSVDQSDTGVDVWRGKLVVFIVILVLRESVKHFSFNCKNGMVDFNTEVVYLDSHNVS